MSSDSDTPETRTSFSETCSKDVSVFPSKSDRSAVEEAESVIELLDPQGDDLEMKQKGFKVALRHPDFLRLWSGQVVSNVGTATSALALLFYAYDLAGSAMAMTVLAMFEVLPVVVFAGFVVVYVDRWNRKRIMIVPDVVQPS